MTERKLWELQVAKYYPEDKKLATNSLENMGVREIREYLRKCNAARNRGELNAQFSGWIVNNEYKYTTKIFNIYRVGNHKIKLTYYGMIYTILEYAGCYLRGKSSTPIGITHNKYCTLLNLQYRLNSNNVRKAIADDFYGHNYLLAIAKRKNGVKQCTSPILMQLESVFSELFYEIEKEFLI